jgi:hypothetical protein
LAIWSKRQIFHPSCPEDRHFENLVEGFGEQLLMRGIIVVSSSRMLIVLNACDGVDLKQSGNPSCLC